MLWALPCGPEDACGSRGGCGGLAPRRRRHAPRFLKSVYCAGAELHVSTERITFDWHPLGVVIAPSATRTVAVPGARWIGAAAGGAPVVAASAFPDNRRVRPAMAMLQPSPQRMAATNILRKSMSMDWPCAAVSFDVISLRFHNVCTFNSRENFNATIWRPNRGVALRRN